MKHISEYSLDSDSRPWLILGKGPSYDKLWRTEGPVRDDGYEIRWRIRREYRVIGLNQAGFQFGAEVVHCIDYEVLTSWRDVLSPAAILWMPYEPHFRERGGHGSIRVFMQHDPFLLYTEVLGEVYTYDLFGSSEKGWPGKTEIYAYCSTFEATLHILSLLGAKEVFTCGIDGGTERHPLFKHDYRREHKSYDYQKPRIEELKETLGIKVVAL